MDLTFSAYKRVGLPVQVYEWAAWTNFLFPSIFKDAVRIKARIQQPNARIIRRLAFDRGYLLFHINLTNTAAFFQDKEALTSRLLNIGITPLNANVYATSKRFVQQICQKAGLNTTQTSFEGEENELLIVKTNLNYGGHPEKRLKRSHIRQLNIDEQHTVAI